MSLLVISEIFGLFLHTLTSNEKYYLPDTESLPQPIQTQLSKKEKLFSKFLLDFKNLHQVLNIAKKKMTLIAYVFPKFETEKDVVS